MKSNKKNSNSVEYDRNKMSGCVEDGLCLHQFIDAVSAREPHAVAVVFEDVELTYGELTTRTNLLANYLRKFGVEKDMLVGLCLERSLDMVIGTIAIQKAGAAYVPLGPHVPS